MGAELFKALGVGFVVKYRIEFSKTGETKFVSHLDLVRLFSRAFKRAQLPLAYSEGFNPHPKMSIGIPLSVGVTSECELLDAEFYQEIAENEIKIRLNDKMPMGIEVLKVKQLAPGGAKLSSVAWAKYCVVFYGAEISQKEIDDFLNRDMIEIEKKTKRSEKVVDIKPDIFSVQQRDKSTVVMELAAGSNANLKPDVVVSAMRRYISDFAPADYDVHRMKLLDQNKESLI